MMRVVHHQSSAFCLLMLRQFLTTRLSQRSVKNSEKATFCLVASGVAEQNCSSQPRSLWVSMNARLIASEINFYNFHDTANERAAETSKARAST